MKGKRSFHWAWVIIATCFVDFFINYSVRLGYGVVFPEMICNLDFGRSAAASIYNAYLFTYIAFTPFIGNMTDRIGARPVITSCLLALGLGVFLMGTITTLWTACLFYAIAGFGAAGMWTPILTVVQRWFFSSRRGLALGIVGMGPGLGLAAMGALFPWILHHFGWRYGWYFLGTVALIMVAVNGILLRSDPQDLGYLPWGGEYEPFKVRKLKAKTHTKSLSVSLVLKNKTFWFIGLSYFSIAYSLYGITTFMVDYAKYQIGLPLEEASLLAVVHGIFMIAGVLTILPLSDYLGRKKTLIISNSCIIVFLIGILLIGNSWSILAVLVGGVAFFYGPTFGMYGACAGDYFPSDMMGTVIGVWTTLYGLGAISVHWVTGILRDTTGIYDHAFAINVVMATASLCLISLVKKGEGG